MKTPAYLNALRAFEASARHKSFSAAAAELHVTPAAVGQLVRSLEDWLGAPLFHRGTRPGVRLVPTEAAERALPDIRAGFDSLTLGLERLKEGLGGGVLTVAVSPSFAAKWLLPRIERFRSEWPTDLRLDTDLKGVDFVAHRIDIGVRYGLGTWPGRVADKRMDEEVIGRNMPRDRGCRHSGTGCCAKRRPASSTERKRPARRQVVESGSFGPGCGVRRASRRTVRCQGLRRGGRPADRDSR